MAHRAPELPVGQKPFVVLQAHEARDADTFPGGETEGEIGNLRHQHDGDEADRARYQVEIVATLVFRGRTAWRGHFPLHYRSGRDSRWKRGPTRIRCYW